MWYKKFIFMIFTFSLATSPYIDAALTMPKLASSHTAIDSKMDWWRHARFGMFIHWGIYSVPAKGEWFMTEGNVPKDVYEKYAREFDPKEFDADRWAKIAHDAGMKYLVITSKHHDGFCMFRTKATHYNIVDATPWHEDPLKALSAACQKYGIKFGVYYSIMDWHSPLQQAHDPDSLHPVYNPTHFVKGEKESYLDYMKTQLRELVTQYHPAILWFDGQWMDGWTEADGKEIYDFVNKLDPKIIINNRVKGAGDYETPEQQIPANGLPGRDWETCMTINNSWGFNAADTNFKTGKSLVRNLIDIASKGGNYLLNVGPTADGIIPQPEVGRLTEMGRWLKRNGESIYETEAGPFTAGLPWGRCTRKPGELFLNVFEWPVDGRLVLHGVYNKPKRAYLLSKGTGNTLNVERSGDSLIVDLPVKAQDEISSVVVLAFENVPEVYNPPAMQAQTKIFIDTLDVTANSSGSGAEIRYTLNGTVPTVESPLVLGPIRLSETSTVTARCFRDGKAVSETAQAVFTKVRPVEPVLVNGAANGLHYDYFEGQWDSIPNFTEMTPVHAGTVPNFTLPPIRRLINYGAAYSGYVRILSDGVYTFYTASDDGSKLFIDDSLVVDNDYLHGTAEREGVIALKAGLHPIRVMFFQAGGEDSLGVLYGSPQIPKQVIPGDQIFIAK